MEYKVIVDGLVASWHGTENAAINACMRIRRSGRAPWGAVYGIAFVAVTTDERRSGMESLKGSTITCKRDGAKIRRYRILQDGREMHVETFSFKDEAEAILWMNVNS